MEFLEVLKQKDARHRILNNYGSKDISLIEINLLAFLFLASILESRLDLSYAFLSGIRKRNSHLIGAFANQEIRKMNVLTFNHLSKKKIGTERISWKLFDEYLLAIYGLDIENILNQKAPVFSGQELVEFAYAKEALENVRVNCYIRKRWAGPSSREHELGYKFKNYFEAGGWQCDFIGLIPEEKISAPSNVDGRKMLVALIDLEAIWLHHSLDSAIDMLEMLKKTHHILIGLIFDPWLPQTQVILENSRHWIDIIWGNSIELSAKVEGIQKYKNINFPFPIGVDEFYKFRWLDGEPQLSVGFVGSVGDAQWGRILWLTELKLTDLVRIDISASDSHESDPWLGFISYMNRLSSFRANISFSQRENGARILTGRTLETIAAGSALIQEYSDDVRRYLVPSEHYFEFSSMGDLLNILSCLQTDNYRLARVTTQASDFIHSRYSSKMMVKHLSHVLD